MFDVCADPFDLANAIPFEVEEQSSVGDGAQARLSRRARRALDKKGQYVVPGFRDSLVERKRAVKWAWGRVLENTAIARCGSVASGGWSVGGSSVVPLVRAYGSAHAVGVVTCHNKHTCPDCGPKADRVTREFLASVVAEEQSRGSQVGMLTFTLSHQLHDKLKDVLGLLLKIATKVVSPGGKQNKRRRVVLGFNGGWKSIECNHSRVNGWHPHVHMPVFWEPGTTDEQIAQTVIEMKAEWLRQCEKHNVAADQAWQHYRPADRTTRGQGIADYVAKRGIEWEATARSTKRGKGASRTIYQIAEDYAEDQWPGDADLMREYHAVMSGTKRITPFGEMRKRYAGRAPGEWEDLFHGEENEAREPIEEVCAIDAEVFNEVCRAGGRERLLHAADIGLVAVKAVLHDFGFEHGLWPPGVAERVVRKRKTPRSNEGKKVDDEN